MATVTAQAAGGSTQTIEQFVGAALDDAKISPLHRKVVALIAAGYFFDVIDFTVFGSLVPFLLKSGFATPAQVAAIRKSGSASSNRPRLSRNRLWSSISKIRICDSIVFPGGLACPASHNAVSRARDDSR